MPSQLARFDRLRPLAGACLLLAQLFGWSGHGHGQSEPPAAIPATFVAAAGPAGFIDELGHQAASILRQRRDATTRREALGRLLEDGIDVPAIGKFVLGRYWRTTGPEQRQQYLTVFANYLVTITSDRIVSTDDIEFQMLGVRNVEDGASAMVSTRVTRPGLPPLRVDWRVTKAGDGYKVVDLVVEGVSMAMTERSDFTAVMDRSGGDIQVLIDALVQKLKAG